MPLKNCHKLQQTAIAIIAVAGAASACFAVTFFSDGAPHPVSDAVSFLVTAPLIYRNLIYQTGRLGALKRATSFRGRLDCATICSVDSPRVTHAGRSEGNLAWNGVTILLGAPPR